MSPSLLSDQKNENDSATPLARVVARKGVDWYKTVALMSMNMIVLLVVANLICYVVNLIIEKDKTQKEDTPSEVLLTQKYHDYTVPQVRELLREKNRDRKFEYAPFVGYRYRSVWKEFLHIDPHGGYRRATDSGLWPPDPTKINIFVFGASTTFGPGVKDDETIPARLQQFLKGKFNRPVEVYNFGTAGYNSTIERVQFSNMLADGLRPDLAVFIDGNMDAVSYNDDPPLNSEFKEMFEDRGHGLIKSLRPFIHDLPMTKLSDKVRETLQPRKVKVMHLNEAQVKHIVSRYLENKQLIEAQARVCNVKTLFVWQPSPDYKFDLKNHPFPPVDFMVDASPTYEAMAKTIKGSSPQFMSDFLWLADMQEHATEPNYVDNTHYRATLCKAIGDEIGKNLIERNFLANKDAPPVVPATK